MSYFTQSNVCIDPDFVLPTEEREPCGQPDKDEDHDIFSDNGSEQPIIEMCARQSAEAVIRRGKH